MANNQVRGITVEIGGDTTKLGKALQDSESKSRSLKNELKEINSALKLDPSNVELAAQKQKVLKEQIEATKEKLDILKTAEEQVARQFKAGEIGEEQFRAFKREIENTESQLKKYQTELDNTNKKSTALEKLTTTIDEQEKEVADLKERYKEAVIEYGKNSEEARRLAGEIRDLSGDLKDNKQKMAEADQAADDLDQSLDDVGDSSKDASDGFTVMKGALADLVADGIRIAIEQLKELATQTFEAGSNFESQMSKVSAISGATGEDFEKLKEKAMEMGGSTKFTATEAAEALEYMAMAGWGTNDMIDGLEGVMNLAAASGEDLGTTSDIVTDALTALGMAAEDAGHFADVLAATSSNANTNVSMMGESFKYVAPVAGALGFSAEDLATALGLMANNGIKASTAGTTLRTLLTNLASPTETVQGAMDTLGISLTNADGSMKSLGEIMDDLRAGFGDLQIPAEEFNKRLELLDQEFEDGAISEDEYNQKVQELTESAYGAGEAMLAQVDAAADLAGKRGLAGLLAIVNTTEEDYDKLTTAIYNCDGAAQTMADTMNDNVSGKLTLLQSKIEGIMITVFDEASDSMQTGINAISDALDRVDWDKFAEGVGDFAAKVADLVVYLLDHSEEVMNVLKGIATAFVTYKAVKTVNNVYNEFSGLFSLISKTGLTSLGGLSTAMAALPFAGLVASIGAVITADDNYAKSVQDAIDAEYGLTDAQKESIQKGSELAEAYKNSRQGSIDYKKAIDDEYLGIEDLVTEYDSLLDDHGRVQRGNEERARYIKTELAAALDIEESKIDEIVQANGRLSGSIDEIIIKREAEALLTADEAQYQAAKEQSAEMTIAYAETVDAAKTAEEKYNAALENVQDKLYDYNECVRTGSEGIGVYREELDNAQEALEFAKTQWEEATQAVDDQGEALAQLNADVRNHEGLASAIIEGDAKKIEEACERVATGFVSSKDGSRQALETQATEADAAYEKIKTAYELGAVGITESMVAEYQSRATKAHTELEAFKTQEYNDMYAAAEQANKGFNAGTSATGYLAENAAADMATRFINKFKEKMKISSPSKVTKELGEQTGEGFIVGLNSTMNQLKKTASNITSGLIETFSYGQDLALAVVAKTDAAHQKALNKLESDYNKKTTKIQAKIAKLEAKGSDLTKAQKKELKELKNQLKEEEKTYKKAVKDLNASVEQEYVNAASARVQKLKKTNSITLNEEVTFWEEIVKSTKKGSAAWEQASQELYDAKQALTTQVSNLTKDFISDAAKVLDDYNQVIESRANKLENSFGLFDAVKLEDAIGGEKLIKNLSDQVKTLSRYEEIITELAGDLGEDNPLYEALKEQGVGAMRTLLVISEMSDEELKTYSDLYAKRSKLAKRIAEEENEALKERAEQQVYDLLGAYEDALVELDGELTSESKELGRAITAGIAQGLADGSEDMNSAMKKTIQAMIKEAKEDLGIHSPSKVMADQIGRWMPPGIAEGFEQATPEAAAEMQRSLAEMTSGLSAGINGATFGRQIDSFGTTFTPTADFSLVLAKIDQLLGAVQESGSKQIVLDSGALVGGTIDKIDASLGTIYAARERGV